MTDSQQPPSDSTIHNGEIIGALPQVASDPLPVNQRPPAQAKGLDPEAIAAAMAREVSSWLMDEAAELGRNPMALVNRLLQLKDAKGQKLVFTRWDLFQCFALWTCKLEGQDRVKP